MDHEYIQTQEKGGSLTLRDSCLRCGRTKAAHESAQVLPAHYIARNWLTKMGMGPGHPVHEMGLTILSQYIDDTR